MTVHLLRGGGYGRFRRLREGSRVRQNVDGELLRVTVHLLGGGGYGRSRRLREGSDSRAFMRKPSIPQGFLQVDWRVLGQVFAR